MTAKKKAYTRAGVDIDLSNPLKRQIQSFVKQTHPTEVLRGDPRFEKLRSRRNQSRLTRNLL
jgi:phosphoribosylaminoimidazole (AIR) synthetase